MKALLAISLVVFAAAGAYAFDLRCLFGGCHKAAETPAAPAPSMALPANIPPLEARDLIASGKPVVIDIRRPEEYAAGHLEAAGLQLDYYAPDFKDRLNGLDRKAQYLIYCRSGHRSGLALAIMKELGFTDAHDIAGGITAWTAAGLPVVK